MTRRSLLIGSAILACWAVTMAVLIKNHYLDASPTPEYTSESLFGSVSAVSRWEDIEEYMLIIQSDKNTGARSIVGATATHIRKHDDPTSTATYVANLQMEGKLSPLLPKAIVKMSANLDRNVNLTAFSGEAKLGSASFKATGAIFGKLLYLVTGNTNNTNLSKREIKSSISMAEALRPALASQMEIETGSKMSTPVLDPLTGQNRGTLTIQIGKPESISIEGKEMSAYRVVSSMGDIDTVMWIDTAGKTLRRQLVGGLAMERTTREKALAHAPTLDETLEIPEVDPGDFTEVPVSRESSSTSSNSAPGLGMLEALLK